jgi:hypothetical protein
MQRSCKAKIAGSNPVGGLGYSSMAELTAVNRPVAGSSPATPARKVKQIGDCSALEKRRGVKALGSSTLPLSVFLV